MPESLQSLLDKTNAILGRSKEIQLQAQREIALEPEKPKVQGQVPVLFGKRAESDVLETHRGNFRRHWEPSAR